jgi:glucose-1-phosphate thymidylyltransferase
MYLDAEDLDVKLLGCEFDWLDTGTIDTLMKANDFIRMMEGRHNLKIAVLEEIAYKKGWIKKEELIEIAKRYGKSQYGEYLMKVAEGEIKH